MEDRIYVKEMDRDDDYRGKITWQKKKVYRWLTVS